MVCNAGRWIFLSWQITWQLPKWRFLLTLKIREMLEDIKSKHLCSLEEEKYIIADSIIAITSPTGRCENFQLVYRMADLRGNSWCAFSQALACRWPELSSILAMMNWTMLRIQRKQILSLHPDEKQISFFWAEHSNCLAVSHKGPSTPALIFPRCCHPGASSSLLHSHSCYLTNIRSRSAINITSTLALNSLQEL